MNADHSELSGIELAGPTLHAEVESLFELNSASWENRLRTAMRPVTLGRLGAYELIREIGRGGQGEVYEAIQPGTGRRVAIKRVAGAGFTHNDPVRRRLHREVQALSRLHHPGVVSVHAVEHIDGHTILVMELVKGERFDDWADAQWASAPQPVPTILSAYLTACQGVAHAHQNAIIHRDIKPSNILVNVDAQSKVLDFGIAHLRDDQLGARTTTGFIGTREYAAPERIIESAVAIDTRSDIYSLGVVLWRALAGPAAAASLGERDRTQLIPRASSFRPCPRECDWIIAKATAPDPRLRYPTVESLADDIRAFLERGPMLAAPPRSLYQALSIARRYRAFIVPAIAITAALAVATALSLSATDRARRALRDVEAAKKTATLESERHAQVAQLMRSVLGGSGIASGARPDISVREALDNAVRTNFPQAHQRSATLDPLVEAALRAAIGETYLQIGRAQDAITHLTFAADLEALHRGPDSDERLSALNSLARAYRANGDLATAEPLHRQIVAQRRAHSPRDDAKLAEALSSHGVALRWLGRWDEAEAAYREAMTLFTNMQGPDSPDAAMMAANIAILLSRSGRHDEAENMVRRGLTPMEAANPRGSPDLAGMFNVLGNILWSAGKYDEGEAALRRSIDMDIDISPTPHVGQVSRLNMLASRIAERGRFEEAIALQTRAAALASQIDGPDSSAACDSTVLLASLLRRSGRSEEASDLCEDTLNHAIPAIARARLLAELGQCDLPERSTNANEATLLEAWEICLPPLQAPADLRASIASALADHYDRRRDASRATTWRATAEELRPALKK